MHHERVEKVGADHHEFPGREIDDAGGLVDENEAQGDEGVDPAHGDAAHDQLRQNVHVTPSFPPGRP